MIGKRGISKTFKEMALDYFEALFFHLPARTEKTRINPQDRRDLNAGSFKQEAEVQPIRMRRCKSRGHE
jgi:hypothetical protein